MKIKIITVGKLKERYLDQGVHEYIKRLSKYAKIDIVEVTDEKAPENLSRLEANRIKEKEGERILARIGEREVVFCLSIEGQSYTSEAFSKEIEQLAIHGQSQLTFVIGGSLGLSTQVLQRAQKQLSFGQLTYPHQLMRVMLVEQIYRAFRIMRGEPYHK